MAVVVPYVVSFLVKAAVSLAVSAVTSWLFAPSIKGPRLSDRNAVGQGYGSPIPRVYGIAKVQASVLWASDLIETTHEEGGKGGGGSVTTYSYSQHVALLVGEGEAQPLRIWAGGKLIWDATTATSDKKVVSYNNVTVYTGSATQTANSLIQSYMGAANTTAYRGTCYVVLQSLQLEKFGNRLPPFEVEVASQSEQVVGVVADWGFVGEDGQTTWNSETGKFVTVYFPGDSTVRFYETDPVTGATALVATKSWPAAATTGAVCYVSSTNELWVNSHNYLQIYHADSYLYDAQISIDNYSYIWSFYHEDTDTVWIHERDTAVVRNAANRTITDSMFGYVQTGKGIMRVDENHVALLNTDLIDVYLVNLDKSTTLVKSYAVTGSVDSVWDEANSRFVAVKADFDNIYIDVPRTRSMFGWPKNSYDWDGATTTTTAYTPTIGTAADCDRNAINNQTGMYIAYGAQIARSFTVLLVASDTLAYYDDFAVTGGPTTAGVMHEIAGVPQAMMMPCPAQQHAYLIPFADRWYGTGVALSTVVADILTRAGLETTEYDVSDLADTWVDGYVIARPMSARDAIEPLRAAYWFDVFESEGKVKCTLRGADAVATIPEDDLGASNGAEPDPEPFVITRGTEEELPQQVDVHYWRKGGEYEVAVQHDKVQHAESTLLSSIELPLVLDDFKARDVASVSLYTARIERTGYQFKTGPKYTHLEPADIVNVTYDGASYRIRLTEKDEGGGIIAWKGVPDDQSLYAGLGDRSGSSGFYTATSSTVGGAVGNSTDEAAAPAEIAPTYARFLDLPPLLPTHTGLGLYVSVTPNRLASTDDWEGAVNYYSLDGGSTFAKGTAFSVESVVGQASGTLGDFSGGDVVDFINSLEIEVAGTLSSTTWAGLMAGQNAMLVGDEIIQFQTATLVGTADNGINRNYRISKLLRGRRGTEDYIGSHAASEICVLLDSRLARLTLPETRLGDTVYRMATVGEDVDDLTSETVTNAAVCLKPFSPVNLRAYKSAAASWDIELSWDRRDRLYGDMFPQSADDIPNAETSEAYDIEIYTDDFATLKRTVSWHTSPSYTYTNAMQVTDFGSTQASIGVKVYQLSTVVGRGFAGSAALTAAG